MCCISLTALEETMATTEFMPAVNREVFTPWLPQNTTQKPVRMNWVVVTDDNGRRQLNLHWNVPTGDA